MRTVFLGTPRAAVPSLRALAASAHGPVAVACRPDRPVGRGRRMTAPPVKVAAEKLGLPVLQPESVRTRTFRESIAAFEPDLLVVVAFGRLLGPRLLAVAPRGAVNVHFSLLPRWRGAAPVQRAVLAGDAETGVTVMKLVEELDAGPVLLQEATSVGEGETAPALEARLAESGASLLVRALESWEAGEISPVQQDESGVTLAPVLKKEEALLDPARPAVELARAVRALARWPGARLQFSGQLVSLLEVQPLAETTDAAPGEVLPPRGAHLPLACGDGSVLLLLEVKPAGKAAMSAANLVNGRIVRPGDLAERPTP